MAENRNVFATQYHFGDRNGLILAIMQYRRPIIDAYRQEMLAGSGQTLEDVPVNFLVRLIHRGMFDQVSPDGIRHYARFLRSALLYDEFEGLWHASAPSAPFTTQIYRSIRAKLSHLPDAIWRTRIRALGRFSVSSIADLDSGLYANVTAEEFLQDLERMVTAALDAPHVSGSG